MSEWQGPWKCEASGTIVDQLERDEKGPYHSLYPYGDRCRGPFVPHDRRALDPRLEAAERRAEALEAELQLVTAPQPEREKSYRARIAALVAEMKDWKCLADRTATAIAEYGAMREKAEDRAAALEVENRRLRVDELSAKALLARAAGRMGAHDNGCASYWTTGDDLCEHFDPERCDCYLSAALSPQAGPGAEGPEEESRG